MTSSSLRRVPDVCHHREKSGRPHKFAIEQNFALFSACALHTLMASLLCNGKLRLVYYTDLIINTIPQQYYKVAKQ